MRQQVRSVLAGGHKISWLAQALLDDDGNVVVEEQLHFTIDGRTVADSQGRAMLDRLGLLEP